MTPTTGTTHSSGSAHVAVVPVSYIPQGAELEQSFAPGDHLEKCPPELLEQYLERGDIRHVDDTSPEAYARAYAIGIEPVTGEPLEPMTAAEQISEEAHLGTPLDEAAAAGEEPAEAGKPDVEPAPAKTSTKRK